MEQRTINSNRRLNFLFILPSTALAVFAMLSVFCAQVLAYGMEDVFQQGRVLTRAPVVDNDGHRVMGLYTVVKGDDGSSYHS